MCVQWGREEISNSFCLFPISFSVRFNLYLFPKPVVKAKLDITLEECIFIRVVCLLFYKQTTVQFKQTQLKWLFYIPIAVCRADFHFQLSTPLAKANTEANSCAKILSKHLHDLFFFFQITKQPIYIHFTPWRGYPQLADRKIKPRWSYAWEQPHSSQQPAQADFCKVIRSSARLLSYSRAKPCTSPSLLASMAWLQTSTLSPVLLCCSLDLSLC